MARKRKIGSRMTRGDKLKAPEMRPASCFNCNGTGAMCSACGEAENVCKCDDTEQNFVDCENCGGTGKVEVPK